MAFRTGSIKGVKFYCAEQPITLRQCWAVPSHWNTDLIHSKNGHLFYKNIKVDAKALCNFDDELDNMIDYCFRNSPQTVFECANNHELEMHGIYLENIDKAHEWTEQETLTWVLKNLARITID